MIIQPKPDYKPVVWPVKLYKKIDIYINGQYWASTRFSKTCRDAVERVKAKYEIPQGITVKARFAK